jgi:predicted 3-demethylubiquinone-9 3-methyltransferase (glyoxalase superfamily)
MGDYNQMAADAQFFYLTWGDNRSILKTERYPNGRPDPDVFFAKIPVQPGFDPE